MGGVFIRVSFNILCALAPNYVVMVLSIFMVGVSGIIAYISSYVLGEVFLSKRPGNFVLRKMKCGG